MLERRQQDQYHRNSPIWGVTTDAIGEKLSLDLFEHYRQISFSPTLLILKRSSVQVFNDLNSRSRFNARSNVVPIWLKPGEPKDGRIYESITFLRK